MPSQSFIHQTQQKDFEANFKAPAMIAKDEKTYGLGEQRVNGITYIELKKENNTWKRTPNQLETNPSDLAREIKNGSVKVILPNKEYMTERNRQRENEEQEADKKKEVDTSRKETSTIKPVLVEPLNVRERSEVKEAMQQGKLEDTKHASALFKQFDRQLQSVPDQINGQKLTNQDKLKLLVGDFSDHQNTKFTVQKDKTVKMEGKENGLLTNANSQFSEKQLEIKNQQKNQESNLTLSR
ncbi:hypothetical protein ACS5NO_32375 [Larkinella sp. GY13]|uniref:hypothetical protein n=1 Tax=Larkinella sp. GY13 TaxID=3453720 RepID=UPI003EEC9255